MFPPLIKKNDRLFRWLIILISLVVFAAVVLLGRMEAIAEVPFDPHIFATANAVINSIVSILLLTGLIAVLQKKYVLHRLMMGGSMVLSMLFLISYICHHLLTESTSYGGEGWVRTVYYFILITHIILAAVILPFILFTTYRALVAEWPAHKKIARITWPIWFYVSVTGVLVYLMISPYY